MCFNGHLRIFLTNMVTFFVLIFLIAELPSALSFGNCITKDSSDPCLRDNHKGMPNMDSRHPSVQYSLATSADKFCDLFAINDGEWYVSDYTITTTCPQQESCGSKKPIWLNGTMPNHADGAVNRSACLRTFDSCCAETYHVLIKNCLYYNVYCFWNLPTDCPQRYCFDVDLTKVTTTISTSTSTTQSAKGLAVNINSKQNQDDSQGVIIGLSAVIVVSVSAIVVLSGLIVVLKKKLASSVIPKLANGPGYSFNMAEIGKFETTKAKRSQCIRLSVIDTPNVI